MRELEPMSELKVGLPAYTFTRRITYVCAHEVGKQGSCFPASRRSEAPCV